MIANQTIQRLFSGVLICIFALSVTPVFFVHTIFVSHKDKASAITAKGFWLSESGYNCHCEDFVTEGQFLNDAQIIYINIVPQSSVFNETVVYTFFSQHHFYSELRGPPSLV